MHMQPSRKQMPENRGSGVWIRLVLPKNLRQRAQARVMKERKKAARPKPPKT